MLARDFVQPMPVRTVDCAIETVLPWLRKGTPVAVRNGAGWQYVRPLDALSLPTTRQLCDVPRHDLHTLDTGDTIDETILSRHEVLGATHHDDLVGRIDSPRVLAEIAKSLSSASEDALGHAARDRLMPKFLHDLSNALTVAQALELELRRHVHDDQSPESNRVEGAMGAIAHAIDLTCHMRALYSDRASRSTPFDLRVLLTRVTPMLEVAAHPAKLDVNIDVSDAVVREPWRLERILLNLVLNASEASPTGCVRVHAHQLPRGGRVAISVDDDGPGFTSGGPNETSRDATRGIGLDSVRRQAALLGGSIEVGVSPLGGARVVVLLSTR